MTVVFPDVREGVWHIAQAPEGVDNMSAEQQGTLLQSAEPSEDAGEPVGLLLCHGFTGAADGSFLGGLPSRAAPAGQPAQAAQERHPDGG